MVTTATNLTFGFTEEQRLMRESVLGLLQRVLPPEKIRALDRAGEFPHEAYAALAEAGFMALPFHPDYGGTGGSAKDLAVLVEAMAYHYASIATAYLTTTIYAGQHIALHGSEELKRCYLPRIADGSVRMAFALTEPEAGSDAAAIRLRAERRGDRWVLNGQKLYITCAHVADHLVTVAKTDPEAGARGISIFLVDAGAPGLAIRPIETLGRRTTRANEVFYHDVEVAADHMIGEENRGWRGLMRCLNLERLCLAAAAAGNMQHVIDYAAGYARERRQFGHRISSFQAIAHKFADMQAMAETSRLLVWRVAEMLDAGLDPVMETAIAKMVATENDFRCADLGMQIMGGAGYTMEHDMQRFFRDSRIGPIGGGSNEIQRNVIAKLMGL
jgi:alkylation response protein AidB-like acyl-CoA dehydrogenase